MECVAVDWSGRATGERRHLWLARAVDGELLDLRCGARREEVIHELAAHARASIDRGVPCAIGLDFAFSLPAWYFADRGLDDVGALWELVAEHGEQWLAACSPPWWGRPGRRRPVFGPDRPPLRRTEASATSGGISAKSVFQVGGAGSVGTGSLRGMPHLRTLREAGCSIWPFDPTGLVRVLEIYPRLCSGPVHKSSPAARRAFFHGSGWRVDDAALDAIERSDDAFDAAVAALVMSGSVPELSALRAAVDATARLEGEIWCPPPSARE